MKLLDFFDSQKDWVIEDSRSISLRRGYKEGDLVEALGIYDECCKMGISFQIDFALETESLHEVILSNFKLQQNGIKLLIESVAAAQRADFTYKLSAAKSLQYKVSGLVEALEEPFSECSSLLRLSVYVPKSDLCEYFQREYSSDLNFRFWLKFQNLGTFIENEMKEFLRIVWNGRFPVFVVYDIQTELNCKFCKIVPMNDVNDQEIDEVAFSVFRKLATEIISSGSGTSFLLNLTLCPLDSGSCALLQDRIDKRLVKEENPLRFGENQFYDFKSKPTEIAKRVTAFANACGGMLIYGIDNDGRIQGCDPSRDPDSVSNAIREILPPVNCDMISSYINGKYVLLLIVFPPSDGVVFTDGSGQRPFRYLANTRLMRTNEEILAARRTQCAKFQ